MSNAGPGTDATNSEENGRDAASPAAPGALPAPATATTPTSNIVTFQQMQQQRGSLSWVSMLAFFMFMMTGGGPGSNDTTEAAYRSALARLTQERDDFEQWLFPQRWNGTRINDIIVTSSGNSTKPVHNDTLPSNHTDFVLPDLTPPEVIRSQVLDLLLPQTEAAHPLFYRNVSGFFKGSWNLRTDVNISDRYNETEIAERRGRFPWNGLSTRKNIRDGRVVRLNVREVAPHEKGANPDEESGNATAVIIRGSLELQLHDMLANNVSGPAGEMRSNEVDLEGLHFLKNGSFFLHAAAPWKDLDMRQVPGLLFTNQSRNSSAQTVLKELNARLARIQDAIDTNKYPDVGGSSDGDRSMNCSFSIYGQLQALPSYINEEQLWDREREIRSPTGISLPNFPTPVVDGIIFSKDCDLVIELDRMEVLELEVFWSKALTYAFVLAVLTAIQTWVLIRQMEYTGTPASISKVSHLTISMQVVLDVYFCVTHLTLGIVTQNRSSLALLIPGFFGILAGLLFGLRYAAIIRVHSYRPTPPAVAPAPITASETALSSTASGVTTPLLAENRTNPDSAAGAVAGPPAVAIMFVAGAIAFVVAIVRFGWFPLLLTLAYSFWLPQIYHNAERGTSRHALLKQYVLATSAIRLFIPLYVWTCPQNLLFTETSPWVFALVAWQIFQILVLLLQDWFGPRFFLPRGFWFAEQQTWDYHPALPPVDIESVGGKTDGKREVDCIICLESIELASGRLSVDQRVADKDSSGAVGDVISGVKRGANRLSYMVPPCHHIAHTSCLETWAAQKMECPLCRRPLPPF